MAVTDASGLLLGIHAAAASLHEVTLVYATLDEVHALRRPQRIVRDRAYDSDPLNQKLATQGIELFAQHKINHKKARTQDGRKLRRYRRRCKI